MHYNNKFKRSLNHFLSNLQVVLARYREDKFDTYESQEDLNDTDF